MVTGRGFFYPTTRSHAFPDLTTSHPAAAMNSIIETLLAIQPTLMKPGLTPAERKAAIDKIGATVPEPIAAHFLRCIAIGRRGVALVRHGVCGECHIRVASATVQNLADPTDVHLCESCGCYLLLPPEEIPVVAAVVAPAPVAVRSKRRAKVAALTPA
jgi:hypothetical protein